MKKLSSCISKRIIELCSQRNMSIYKLELKAGISHSTMCCLLNSKYRGVNIRTVFLIIQALELSVLDFFNSPLFENLDNIDLDWYKFDKCMV